MKRLLILIPALLLVATACGGDDAGTTVAASDTAAPPAATEPAVEPPAETEPAAPVDEPTDAAEEPAQAAGEAALVLEPGALSVATGESLAVHEFGSADRATVDADIINALGEPTDQETLECGAGTLDYARWDGFSTYYQDGTLVGWYVDQPEPPLTLTSGIGLGSKLGDIRGAYDNVTVEETSIGFEFSADDQLFGVLTADSDHDTVTTLWSGANCIAR